MRFKHTPAAPLSEAADEGEAGSFAMQNLERNAGLGVETADHS
jgi:hypothetical protein